MQALVRSCAHACLLVLAGATARSQSALYTFTGDAFGDSFGNSVSGAGDVNQDGIDDAVFGAPDADAEGAIGAGQAFIVLGSSAFPRATVDLSEVGSSVAGFLIEGFEGDDGGNLGDALGNSVSGGFDLTGDGVDDVLIGAPFADSLATTPQDAGETYVISPLAPDEVMEVELDRTGSDAELQWAVPHRALSFNVYRGSLGDLLGSEQLRTSEMAPLACALPIDPSGSPPTISDGDSPVGLGWFYLVTARNAIGCTAISSRS